MDGKATKEQYNETLYYQGMGAAAGGAVLTGYAASGYVGAFVTTQGKMLLANPKAYLFILLSNPVTWEVGTEIAFDIASPDGAPLSPTGGLDDALRGGKNIVVKTPGEIGDSSPQLIKGVLRNAGLPGPNGAFIGDKRLSESLMRDLSEEFGVEFAQVYTPGSGKNGGGGYYTLYAGTIDGVILPFGKNNILINHTHPGGTEKPSEYDVEYLKIQELDYDSPQRSSEILPLGKESIIFNKNSPYIDRHGNLQK